jgi:hypothetical protein
MTYWFLETVYEHPNQLGECVERARPLERCLVPVTGPAQPAGFGERLQLANALDVCVSALWDRPARAVFA